MKHLSIHSNQLLSTAIPNRFFDEYMPQANGEFVKVYLYLLRSAALAEPSLSISGIADKLNHTEKDVLRALRYWEQAGLLSLSFSGEDTLTDIRILDYPAVQTSASPAEQSASAAAKQAEFIPPEKASYTKAQLARFLEMDDISQILYVAQRYLGKTLNSTETDTIIYFYDSLHFPADLIEYLIEYCVSREHKSIRYIETVALAWAGQGITSVEEAKSTSALYSKYCFSVMKAFGLSNRNPGKSELDYIQKWHKTYHFDLSLIIEACNRTIQSIHQPNFEYADTILKKWHSLGIKHLSDIDTLDQAFLQNKSREKESKEPQKPSAGNKFNNNITPRSYLYDDLEKQLINH